MEINIQIEQDLKDKNYYKFLLKVKTELRKLIKKEQYDVYPKFLVSSLKILVDLKEMESCLDLIKYFLDEFEKSFTKINDKSFFLRIFKLILETIATLRCDIKIHIASYLRITDKYSISNEEMLKYGIYDAISKHYQNNGAFNFAYKYSLYSLDHNCINDSLNLVYSNSKNISTLERFFFVTRAVLELLIKKKTQVAHDFIKLNMDKQYDNNHPLINFSYLLIILLENYANFDNYWNLITKYKPSIEIDANLAHYLNKISINYFDKPIIQEQNNMLTNLMKMMSG